MEDTGKDFSFENIKDFDKHIQLSIPNYTHVLDLVKSISSYFLQENSIVYDLGCSTGNLLKQIDSETSLKNLKLVGYDISENLLSPNSNRISFIKKDITDEDLDISNANIIFSIFTLQFISLSERKKLLKKIYDNLNVGGAFVICEKIYLDEGLIQDIYTFSYYDYKRKSFDAKTILDKQIRLREIMKPLSESDNLNLFREAGFTKINSFFQSLNFKGWLLIK
ncbi:methyltransferase domain-containing protein [Candidatus Woesearchaeota archaeon]|nr:methyltransferase domain-containing protein [Candidatus Woesearchaeota archaeon]